MTKKQLEKNLKAVKESLWNLGPLRPGSMTKQYNVCGSPGCKCKDAKNPQKHGPYYKLSSMHDGKGTTKFIKSKFVTRVELQLKEYKELKRLVHELITLSIAISDLEQTED